MSLSLSDAEFVGELTASQLRIKAFIATLLKSSADVEDVAQNVSLALWTKRKNYKAGSDFLHWAHTIVLAEVRRMASGSPTTELCFDTDLVDTLASEYLELEPELEERVGALNQCLEKLDEDDRKLLQDRYCSGYQPHNLSRQRGCTLRNLYYMLARIRGQLHNCVESRLAQQSHATRVAIEARSVQIHE